MCIRDSVPSERVTRGHSRAVGVVVRGRTVVDYRTVVELDGEVLTRKLVAHSRTQYDVLVVILGSRVFGPVLADRGGLYAVRRCGDLSRAPLTGTTGTIPGRRYFAVATCSGGKSEVCRGAIFTDIEAPREVDRHILHRITKLVDNRGGNRMVIALRVHATLRGQRNAVNYRPRCRGSGGCR